ncbi:hypothetical protein B484DRAFT_272833 [Ochromonadaceae sp. CCMP2298]|nr:hypothetical protein B484DRAFT_272833 [Ochromonadaceae sp. CCMP2298]
MHYAVCIIHYSLTPSPVPASTTLPPPPVHIIQLGYYGVILYATRAYTEHDGGGVSGVSNGSGDSECSFDYPPLFLNALSEVFGVLVPSLLIDRLGRVKTQMALYALAGVAVLGLGLEGGQGWGLLMLSVTARWCVMGSSVSRKDYCARRREGYTVNGVGDYSRQLTALLTPLSPPPLPTPHSPAPTLHPPFRSVHGWLPLSSSIHACAQWGTGPALPSAR